MIQPSPEKKNGERNLRKSPPYRSNNDNRLKGDAYISTQELQDKLAAEQNRIRAKREGLRNAAAKRQQAQAQSILYNNPGTAHSTLFSDYVERTTDESDYDIGPDYAATPLDALADSFTALCSPPSVTYGMDYPPTASSYYGGDLEDTASLSTYQTDYSKGNSTVDYSIDDSTVTDDSIAHDSGISSLTDLNRYRKPAWWKKVKKSEPEDTPPRHETIMQHLGKRSPSYVKEFLEEKRKEDLAVPAGESTCSDPPINIIHTPSKSSNHEDDTTVTFAENEDLRVRVSTTTKDYIAADDDEDAATRRRTKTLLYNTMNMLKHDDDEETTIWSINTDDESQRFVESPMELKESQHDQMRSEKEIAKSNALKKLRQLSEQKRNRQRATKSERLAKKKPPVWCLSRINCERKCHCHNYFVCKTCTLRYLSIVACAIFLLLCIVGIILLTLDPFNPKESNALNHATSIDDSSGSDGSTIGGSGCLGDTNIVSNCQCKSELSQQLSPDISFYRKLLLQYLVNAQIIPYDADSLVQEDEEIAKLFAEGEESCNSYNQVLLFLTDADKQSDSSSSLTALAHRFVLILLYQTLGGQFWDRQDGWVLTGESFVNECNGWHGISCNANNEVLQLDLSNNKLRGDLTTITQVIGQALPALRVIDLSNNYDLYGQYALDELLAQSNQLPTLQKLDLNFGSFYGATIPTEIGRLSRLTELHLGHGKWEGTLPTELGRLTQLRVLDLSNNLLNGTLPKELGQLTQLRQLNLSNNNLSGSLPDKEYEDLRLVESLDVSDNALTGGLPQSWRDWDQLETLVLKGNSWDQLRLPDEPYGLNLQYIYLIDDSESSAIAIVPEEYCFDLPFLDVFRAGCPIGEAIKVLPCSCCNCY